MDQFNSQCAAQSIDFANNVFGLMLQTFVASQCSLASSEKWPKDYADVAMNGGIKIGFIEDSRTSK